MAKNRFLDKRWQKAHLEKIKGRAGNRYTPELNVNLPIAEIFDGISRTENFYTSVRRHYGKLNRKFDDVSNKYEDEDSQKLYQNLEGEISQLAKTLDKLKEYNTEKISWDKLNKRANKAIGALWKLSAKLREEKDKSKKFHSNIYYHLGEVQKELRFFEELSSSTKAKLSNSPLLFLTGKAGTGKTHLLCDVVESRIVDKKMSAILIFGELFATSKDPFEQIIRQLNLENINKSQFLRLLNDAGKQSNCRTILVIDALNETRQKNFWKRNLNKVVDEIKKYPNIALVVSVRTGFEEEVITKKLKKDFIDEEHRGFEFREWEAVNKFFKAFQLPLPEIPLLMPEFQHPLFLLLFCKAFQERTKQNKNKKQKQIFRGHEGATYIFESFVDGVSRKIAKQFGISTEAGKNIWDTVIEKIATEMVNQNDDRISEDQVIGLVKEAYPSIDYDKFIKELEKNLLIVKVPRYSEEKNDYDGFDFRFPFQKFSDHLIGRYIFKKYEEEFGKSNKNLQTAKKFFSKRRKLGKFLADSWSGGIVEALSIQCPEYLKGSELAEVAPYLKDSYVAQDAFVESLIWRNPDAFSTDRKNTLAYINSKIIRTEVDHNNLLNAFLAVAPIPNHPFNADFLHKHLSKFSMAKRDSWWSTFLHYQHGEKTAVNRLIEWGWSRQDKTHINDDSIRLCSVALCWFLTTPNRFLRDKATKALVALLTNRLSVVLALLKQFEDVNDFYVVERLYAVAYGCAIRSRSDKKGLKLLSKWIYGAIFKQGNPPAHILLRDYARGIIEVALHEKVNISIDRKKIEPPYNSNWSKKVPSEKSLKNKYYPESFFQGKTVDRGFIDVWSSVMSDFRTLGDFGNYVLNYAVTHWSGRRLNGEDTNLNILFNNFKDDLTKKQKELLEKATNPFFGIDASSIRTMIKYRYISPSEVEKVDEEKVKQQERKQQKEMKKAHIDFRNSLSEKKKKFFDKKIKPFLDDRGSINDPKKYFNTGLGQRWVFNRVVQLGWKPELHGEFDKFIGPASRYEHKAERIGKKYQWIALHELLARVSDNFEFKEESWSEKAGKYEGPWQLSIRDIDPSCILKEFPNEKLENIPVFSNTEIQNQYDAWNEEISDSAWLKKTNDLPNPKQVIEFVDDQENIWVTLEGSVDWQEKTPPEQEEYNQPTQRLWYMVKSYLVYEKDKDKIFRWAKQQHFMGRWMPESHEFYRAYLGEYPWAPAFFYLNIPYHHHDGWTDKAENRKIPVKILVTDDQYLSSGSSIDCSTNHAISVKLPAKFIVDGMKLTQKHIDGRFFDGSELVAFDPSVFNDNAPKHVLIRKDKLNEFLKRKGYAIFWTLLGEKNMIGGDWSSQYLGRLEIDGAYTLNNQNKIVGSKKSYFRKPTDYL